jgi:hypothetical protein
VELGRLLSTVGVHYVVVLGSLAPEIPGYQAPVAYPAPTSLTSALAGQTDLEQVPGQAGLAVYVDTASPVSPLHPSRGASWAYRGGIIAEVVVWLGLAGYLARRRWLDVPGRRRRHRGRSGATRRRADGRAGPMHHLPVGAGTAGPAR